MSTIPETVSFLGKPLPAPSFPEVKQAELNRQADEALAAVHESDSPASRSAAARALRAAGRFREAIRLLTIGLNRWPADAELLTARGHTYVNVRAAERAQADLEQATELAPRSFDAWYHLALSRWYQHEHAAAAEAFGTAAEVTDSDSSRLAAHTWQYTALLRSGQREAAAALLPTIRWDVDLEGRNYNYQLRARFYQGSLSEEELIESLQKLPTSQGSLGFGLGIWHLLHGNEARAREHFQTAVAANMWPAFGVAASELELAALDGAEPVRPEAYSLLGEPLFTVTAVNPANADSLSKAEDKARTAFEAAPADVGAIRAYAKAIAAQMRFRDAIEVLDAALDDMPGEPLLLTDRGHYRLNIREFDFARTDLQQAAASGIDDFDIWYHSGLLHWFEADYEAALTMFVKARDTVDPETLQGESHLVAISDWIYLACSQLGRHDEAQEAISVIRSDMKTTGNNHLYLKRLLFYKGELTEDELIEVFEAGGLALASYFGLGYWHKLHGSTDKANSYFRKVVENGNVWAGWAHIASELELLRGAA